MLKIIFIIFILTVNFYAESLSVKLLPPSGNQIYFGAFPDFGGSENEVSTQKIEAFETLIDKPIAWAYFSQNWFNGIVYPKAHIHAIHQAGVVPFVRIMPRSDEIQGHAEITFSMQNIIDGNFDSALKKWAQDAKKDNIPLLVDFAVEMNGDWFQWSGIFNGGATTDGYGNPKYPDGPERFRDAYRHIIDIFRAQGVKHITWFFHADHGTYPNESWNKAKNYYPGDDYIDWIGFSLYGVQEVTEPWDGLSFSNQLKMHYSDIKAISHTKPIALLEFGVTDNHLYVNKSQWLEDALNTILSNPYIHLSAINAWHENWENEDGTFSYIRLDSSNSSLITFKNLIHNPRFITDLHFQESIQDDEYSFLPAIYGLLLE